LPVAAARRSFYTMDVRVECYAGHRGEETPRALVLGERRVGVVDVIDRWLEPDHRYFKLRGDDGSTYIVRNDAESGDWTLVVYEREPGRARDPDGA
jgi:hypothetical protein